MKRLAIGIVIAAIAATTTPSQAKVSTVSQRRLTFEAPLACTIACPAANTNDGCTMDDPTVATSASDYVVKVPSTANFMIFKASPQLDWDLVVCRRGKNLGHSANGLEVTETVAFFVKPGYSYRLRAWNWADATPLPAKLVFKRLTF